MTGFNLKSEDIAKKTRNPKDSLEDSILKKINNPIQKTVNKKVLISGENGTAKSSLSLELCTSVLNDDECIFYVDIDRSGLEIIGKFHEDELNNRNIIPLIPYQTKTEKGAQVIDPQQTIYEISNIADVVRKITDPTITDKKYDFDKKIAAVIVDGMSFALSYCEDFMREEAGISVDAGVKNNLWKIRADKFREITSAYMALPLPVIFISHEDFIPEDVPADKSFSLVKKSFINEISTRITLTKEQSEQNDAVINYIATVRKNRSDLNFEDVEFAFMKRKMNKDSPDDIQVDIEKLLEVIFPNRQRSKKEK